MAPGIFLLLVLGIAWFFIAIMLLEGESDYDTLASRYRKGELTKNEFIYSVVVYYSIWFWPLAIFPWILYFLFRLLWKMVTLFAWAFSDETELPDA